MGFESRSFCGSCSCYVCERQLRPERTEKKGRRGSKNDSCLSCLLDGQQQTDASKRNCRSFYCKPNAGVRDNIDFDMMDGKLDSVNLDAI